MFSMRALMSMLLTIRSATWLLFVTYLFTLPAPFFLIVVGGLIPTAATLFVAVKGLIVALPKGTSEGFFMLGMLAAHVVFLPLLCYLIAAGVARLIFWVLRPRFATIAVVACILAMFAAGSFAIYRLPGHNSMPPANLWDVFFEFRPR
jgi:hypothetical protein